jgi:hypothetical protein
MGGLALVGRRRPLGLSRLMTCSRAVIIRRYPIINAVAAARRFAPPTCRMASTPFRPPDARARVADA